MGEEFISVGVKQNKWSYFVYKFQMQPELILIDDYNKYVSMEATFFGTKILIMGIYTPNEDEVTF